MQSNYSKIWLIVLLLLSLSASVLAAEPDPIVIVVTGTLLPSEISATSALVEVIEVEPDEEIETVWELLDEIPGVQLNQSRPFPGGVSTVSIWGSHSAHVLVLVDGVALNSSQSGTYDLSLIPLEAVERIEIQKGSSSSLYGTSAIGGVINIITKKGYDSRSSVKLKIGSWGQREAILTSQGELASDMYYALNLGYRSGDGYQEHSAYTSGDLYSSWIRDLDPYSSIALSVLAIDNECQTPAVGGYSEGVQKNNRLRLQSRYMREDDDGSYLEAALWWDAEEIDYQGDFSSKDRTNTIGYNLIRSWVMNHATLSVATDGRFDEVNSTYLDSVKRLSNYGLTAEVMAPIGVGWEALAVGRVDYHSQFGAHFSPRVGLVKSAFGGLVKLNVGSAFKAPTANDLYVSYVGNPDLKPERGWSAEAQYLSESRAGSQWGISGFYRKVDDLIAWVPVDPNDLGGLWQPKNFAEVEVVGAEVSVSQRIRSDLTAQAYATILSATGYDEEEFTPAPLEYGLTLLYQPSPKLTGTLKLAGAGKRYNGLAAYTTVDLGVHYQFRPDVRVHASLTNLFDEEYQLVASYPMPGRQFKAGITCAF